MKIALYPNLKKTNAVSCVFKTCDILHNNSVLIYADEKYKEILKELDYVNFGSFEDLAKEADYIIVIGGDGTILKCSKIIASYHKPILGINSGRLGFMATLESNELALLNDFAKEKFTVIKKMMLKAEVRFKNGDVLKQSVLNDIVVAKSPTCKIADFEVSMNDTVISSLRADGLIFSTPTGSTAYSLSAGGPIIDPDMESIEFTQICPFSLFARSMLFASDKILHVTYSTTKDTDVIISFDGNEEIVFAPGDDLYVSKSDNSIYMIDINGSNFYNAVNKKLMQPFKTENEVDLF